MNVRGAVAAVRVRRLAPTLCGDLTALSAVAPRIGVAAAVVEPLAVAAGQAPVAGARELVRTRTGASERGRARLTAAAGHGGHGPRRVAQRCRGDLRAGVDPRRCAGIAAHAIAAALRTVLAQPDADLDHPA